MGPWLRGIALSTVLMGFPVLALAQPTILPRESPAASVSQRLGVGTVVVSYHRPALRGRKMFGGMVEYGKVWRAGANEATTISFTHDVSVEGRPLAAGTYSIFMIPDPERWTIVFNHNSKQWGAFSHKPAEDVLRFDVTPTKAPLHERLVYSFPQVEADQAELAMNWETTRVAFKIRSDTRAQTLSAVRDEFPWHQAFGFSEHFLTQRIHGEALRWARIAVLLEENSSTLVLQADCLAALGRFEEAVPLGERALTLAEKEDNAAAEKTRVLKRLENWKAGREGLPRRP